jgi:uncharacterized protein with HEPN domain
MARRQPIPAEDIMAAIANIESDVEGHDLGSFRLDRRTRQLVERNLEIISEASRRLPPELKGTEPEIDWGAIAGIGNILRHGYQKVDPKVLWETCEKDLAPLKAAVGRIRRRMRRGGGSQPR